MITLDQARPFFRYARMRELRRLMKEVGRVPDGMLIEAEAAARDAVLSAYRFCNVFREDDTTTRWFREHIRGPLWHDREVLLAVVAFRWFNRISTWQTLEDHWWRRPSAISWLEFFKEWRGDLVYQMLERHGSAPWVTGSYLIKTPAGMGKLAGVLECIDVFAEHWRHYVSHIEPGETTLEGVHETLAEQVPFLGSFMAYEIVTDLRHTYLLGEAPDIMTWAAAGPGAARGLGRLLGRGVDLFRYSRAADQVEMIALMSCLLQHSTDGDLWPVWWPAWEMREVEHTLCEFDKYERAWFGEGRPRQLYRKGA